MEAARLGVWQLDLSTGEIQCSAQCKANFGLAPDAPLSERRLFDELIHPEDRAGPEDLAASVTASVSDVQPTAGARARARQPTPSRHCAVGLLRTRCCAI